MGTVFSERELALGAGCISQYVIGGLVYAAKWPSPLPETFGYHEIFHLFTCLASCCTYLMNMSFIMREEFPAPPPH